MFQETFNSKKKEVRCKFCASDVLSKNFVRHVEKCHHEENEVKKILENPKSSKERRQAFILLRNDTNFDLYIKGETRPRRYNSEQDSTTFYPCIYCKGVFKKEYLKRHTKACKLKVTAATNGKTDYIAESQTLTACSLDPTNTISRLNVKNEVCYLLHTVVFKFLT